MAIFKTIAGHLLDWAGVANVPAALTALEGLKGEAGQIIEIGGVDAQGGVTELVAVDKPGGGADSGQNVINVKSFGAVGDGATDDTDAIAAAIAALPTGGTLYFPAGTYMVNNIMAKSDMTIQGDGWGSVIKLLPYRDKEIHGRSNCISIYRAERVIVRDIKVDGDRPTQRSSGPSHDSRLDGIWIRESSDIFVENVWMYNNGYHGTIITLSRNITFTKCRSSDNGFRPIHGHRQLFNVVIDGCICENNGLGVDGGSGYENDAIFFFATNGLTISNNIVRSNRRGCICVGSDQATGDLSVIMESYDVTITGNVCECYKDLPYVPANESDTGVTKFASTGIMIYGSADLVFENFTVSGNTIRNANIAIDIYSADNTQASINGTITGNTILNCSTAVRMVEVSDLIVSNNQFRKIKKELLYAQSVKRCIISGNNLYSPELDANDLCRLYGCDMINIQGNQLRSGTTNAIYVAGTCSNVVVANNVLGGFGYSEPVINPNGHNFDNIVLDVDSDTGDSGDTGDTEVTLTSISATYSGGDVAVGTAVSALTGVVVTAIYSDGTSETVTGYAMSGTIAEGDNTVTVTYQGMTATFTVAGVTNGDGDGDGGDSGDSGLDYPDDPDVETEKVKVSPYTNNGFVRENLQHPNYTSTSFKRTNPVAITDADVRYELNTWKAVPIAYTDPYEWPGDTSHEALVILESENLEDAVGIIHLAGNDYGTVVFSSTNIPGTNQNTYGVTVSISAQKVRELFPNATHIMMQVANEMSVPEDRSAAYLSISDGHSYVYRAVSE